MRSTALSVLGYVVLRGAQKDVLAVVLGEGVAGGDGSLSSAAGWEETSSRSKSSACDPPLAEFSIKSSSA
jgi:hypothetical protein